MLWDVLMNGLNYGSDFNFHLLTVANPDGYVHSQTQDKMWRKNRRPSAENPQCPGVDLNRNFGFKHGFSGTDLEDQCAVIYSPEAFSEHESKAIRDYVEALPEAPILGLDIHSHANMMLYPYGYAANTFP